MEQFAQYRNSKKKKIKQSETHKIKTKTQIYAYKNTQNKMSKGMYECGVAIIQRDGSKIDKRRLTTNPPHPVYLIDVPSDLVYKNASSTEMRKRIVKSESILDITYPSVQKYMIEHNILGAQQIKLNNHENNNDNNTQNIQKEK